MQGSHFVFPPRDERPLGKPPQAQGSVPPSPRSSFSGPRPTEANASQSMPYNQSSEQGKRRSFSLERKSADFPPPKLGTPPPTAPSGPRNALPFNASPQLQSPGIPTAPKADRVPPTAPIARRAAERGPAPPNRVPERGPPQAARGSMSMAPLNRPPNWNQWIRPGAPVYRENVVPAKRDAAGEEKEQNIARPSVAQDQDVTARQVGASNEKPAAVEMQVPAKGTTPVPQPMEMEAMGTTNGLRDERETRPSVGASSSAADDGAPYEPMDIAKSSPEPPKTSDIMSSDDFSDDDGMDLDEEDFANNKDKFERQKTRLESQMIDLSAREYRATTPLEQIARLAKISVKDLPDQNEIVSPPGSPSVEPRSQVADEESPSAEVHDADEEARQDLLTPKEEEEEEDAEARAENPVRPENQALDGIMPIRKQSPVTINLPYLCKSPPSPLSERDVFREGVSRQNVAKDAIVAALQHQQEEEDGLQQELQSKYLEVYRKWKHDTLLLDREREQKDEIERHKSAEPVVEPEIAFLAAETEAFIERRTGRAHKYSSEYDIQQVLKESEETARLEQERIDRENNRVQADKEKEAKIPDMLVGEARERRIFKNCNRYRSAWRLTDVFGYEPPLARFNEEEEKIFLDTFKERPKKWGEIAARLPGRTYQDCIHHYYANKWDGRFNITKKWRRGKGTRGRGGRAPRGKGAQLMADLSRGEDSNVGSASVGQGVSQTGRPRRNVARTSNYAESSNEAKIVSSTPASGRKGADKSEVTGEPGPEKPAKRRKNAATEKATRRIKTQQPLAAAPAASPMKMDRPGLPRSDLSKEELARAQSLEEASLLTGFQTGHHSLAKDMPALYPQESFVQAAPAVEGSERPRTSGEPSRPGPSSYWSVPENTDFIKYIEYFGTDFAAIAAHMKTKTATMVRGNCKGDIYVQILTISAGQEQLPASC